MEKIAAQPIFELEFCILRELGSGPQLAFFGISCGPGRSRTQNTKTSIPQKTYKHHGGRLFI